MHWQTAVLCRFNNTKYGCHTSAILFLTIFFFHLSIGINSSTLNHCESFVHESHFEDIFDDHDKVELADEWLKPDDIACCRHLQKEIRVAPFMKLPSDELPSEHQRGFCPPQNSMTDTTVVPFNIEHPSSSQQELVSKLDPDNPRYHQAMASADSDAFKEAMVVEIKT